MSHKGKAGKAGSFTVWMAVGAVLLYLAVWAVEKIAGKKEGMD